MCHNQINITLEGLAILWLTCTGIVTLWATGAIRLCYWALVGEQSFYIFWCNNELTEDPWYIQACCVVLLMPLESLYFRKHLIYTVKFQVIWLEIEATRDIWWRSTESHKKVREAAKRHQAYMWQSLYQNTPTYFHLFSPSIVPIHLLKLSLVLALITWLLSPFHSHTTLFEN